MSPYLGGKVQFTGANQDEHSIPTSIAASLCGVDPSGNVIRLGRYEKLRNFGNRAAARGV